MRHTACNISCSANIIHTNDVYGGLVYLYNGCPLASVRLYVLCRDITLSVPEGSGLQLEEAARVPSDEREEGSGPIIAATLKDHSKYVVACRWAPDGSAFITASHDKVVSLYVRKRCDDGVQPGGVGNTRFEQVQHRVRKGRTSAAGLRVHAEKEHGFRLPNRNARSLALPSWLASGAADSRGCRSGAAAASNSSSSAPSGHLRAWPPFRCVLPSSRVLTHRFGICPLNGHAYSTLATGCCDPRTTLPTSH